MRKLVWPLFVAALTVGCADEGSTDKGPEEQPLTNGKDDSFFRPTEHGALQFGIENQASLTDDAKFHAWTFSLSDDAEVSLKTQVSANLDSVMYLYFRENSGDSWGSYLEKNDDHDGNIWSQIDVAGKAGEYRVVVKGFKSALRGSFAVIGSCDGAGCPTSDSECTNGEFDSYTATTNFTSSCVPAILGVLGSPVVAENSGTVPVMTHCSVSGMVQRAVSDYADYWQGFIGLDDLFYDDLDEAEFEFEYTEHAEGYVIEVGSGGDEEYLTLIYDKEGTLLADYQHNQSPTVEYHCGVETEETIEHPWAECFWDVWQEYPFEGDAPTNESGTDTLDNVEQLSYFGVGEAVADFRAQFGADVDAHEVDFTIEEFANATQVYLESTGVDDAYATYTFIPQRNGQIMVRESLNSTIECE